MRLWPVIVLFAFLSQLAVAATMSIPLGRSFGMFTGNVSQPLIAATVLLRLGHHADMLDTPQGHDRIRPRCRDRRASRGLGHLGDDA